MATTPTVLFRGAASTSSTTLYTAPSGTNVIVSEILVANTASSAATFTISMNGIVVIGGSSVPANSTAFFNVSSVLPATQIIAGFASATTVNFSISGVTIV